MHNKCQGRFLLGTIGSACLIGLLAVAGTPARATPVPSSAARMDFPPTLLTSFRAETWCMHGQPPAARGAGLWRADRVVRSPVVPGVELPPAGHTAGPLCAARRAMSRPGRVTGHPGGGRLVSATVLLVASRRRRGRRRGTRVRNGRGRYGLRYLATACSRLLLVLQQSATHPRLLGCLSPVRAAGCQPAARAAVCGGASLDVPPPSHRDILFLIVSKPSVQHGRSSWSDGHPVWEREPAASWLRIILCS